jgi:uncharacterized protein
MNNWNDVGYLSISTQKRDGTWVNTPVWFAYENGIFYLFSEGKAGKVKRIRNFSDVKICPCTMLGKLTGEWQNAEAVLLSDASAITHAHSALLRKYGWQMRILDLGSSVAGKKSKRAFIQVQLSI